MLLARLVGMTLNSYYAHGYRMPHLVDPYNTNPSYVRTDIETKRGEGLLRKDAKVMHSILTRWREIHEHRDIPS